MGGIGKSEVLRKVYSWFLENPGEHFYAHIAYLYYTGEFETNLGNAIDYSGKNSNSRPIEYLKHLANTSKILLFIDDVRNQEADKSEIYEEDASFEEIVGSNISIEYFHLICLAHYAHGFFAYKRKSSSSRIMRRCFLAGIQC